MALAMPTTREWVRALARAAAAEAANHRSFSHRAEARCFHRISGEPRRSTLILDMWGNLETMLANAIKLAEGELGCFVLRLPDCCLCS
jgi:hypothetical protein